MRLVLKFKLANDNSLVTLKVYKQREKNYIGVELLHVAQIDNDVK